MGESEYKKIQIVDSEDNFLANVSFEEAIAKKAIRRASRIMVINESGRVLIQKRSKYISKPLLFDNSVGGMLDAGETYEQAAYRELGEELGITNCPLREVLSSTRSGDFFISLFVCAVPDDIAISYDEHEVDSISWMSVDEVKELVTKHPEMCTPALIHIWTDFSDRIKAT